MPRNKATEFKIIQQIVGKDLGAINILCACADKDRFDVVESIRTLNRKDANLAISSDMIIKMFEERCNSDIDKFIALIDKQFRDAKEVRKYFD